MDAGDCDGRSVHLRGARVQEPAAEEHRHRCHYRRPAIPRRVLGCRDDRSDIALQTNALRMAERDLETRARLLNAAARLFAEHGFAGVTVRDICRKARANVAAVNYHFGGKDGLYTAVMRMAIETMQGTTEAARAAGQGLPPEQRIRAYVAVFADRLLGSHHETWIHQLMIRELSDPT